MTLPLAAAVNELATRIEAQAGELERQRAELAALRAQLRLPLEADPSATTNAARVSRLGLIKAVTSTAAGIGALTWLGDRASAASMRAAGMVGTYLRVTGPGPRSGIGVDASSAKARFTIGVFGRSVKGIGVLGAGRTGVKGTSDDYQRPSVHGVNTAGGDGVFGISPGNGVHGQNTTLGIGVLGTSQGGIAVAGQDNGSGTGVSGTSNGTGLDGRSLGGYDGVYGSTSGAKGGAGVHGSGGSGDGVHGTSGTGAGVHGISDGSVGVLGESAGSIGVYGSGMDTGVRGDSAGGNDGVYGSTGGENGGAGVRGESSEGPGVWGKSNSNAGGYFESAGAAQLHLNPGGQSPPANGRDGDFFVNVQGYLYYHRGGWILLA